MARWFPVILFACIVSDTNASEPKYAKDIQPLFQKHCWSCHGESEQKGGLRLDQKAAALAGGDSGKVLIAGNVAKSYLFERVNRKDEAQRMPPKGPGLSATELAVLQQWIKSGLEWPDDGSLASKKELWWSFQPLQQPKLTSKKHPIDELIQNELNERHLVPSARASKRTLIRRLYFDVIGLPPLPEQIDEFINDPNPNAYGKLVDQLLASPHYGERWARHWLDVVHYGETHGYDKDKPRPNAWPYRDYVIRSLNEDKPYSQFIEQQIAADVLSKSQPENLPALGFLAAGPWDFIGHAELPESKLDGQVARHLDRDDFVANTMNTFVGLTVHCAQCHNHKFDPIPQVDYYKLQSVFAAIDRTNRKYDANPAIGKRRQEITYQLDEAQAQLQAWRQELSNKAGPKWVEIQKQLDKSQAPTTIKQPAAYGYHSAITSKQDERKWVQIDLGQSQSFVQIRVRPCYDDFNQIGAGFGFPIRFRIESSPDADFESEVSILADETQEDFPNPDLTPYIVRLAKTQARYIRITAFKLALRKNDYHLALAEVEVLDREGSNLARKALVTAKDSVEAPARWQKSNLTDDQYPAGPNLDKDQRAELKVLKDRIALETLGQEKYAQYRETQASIQRLQQLALELPAQQSVYAGGIHSGQGNFIGTGNQGGKPRPIFLLNRGSISQPIGEALLPGALSIIPNLSADLALSSDHHEGMRRAALAKWITNKDNVLTWRVMANRLWQYHFGRGLVDSPNDFGKMGEKPSHPELLDYLAAELRDHQSLKRLHRLILTSHTYQQVSTGHPNNEKIDQDNRTLWRQNRRKLEAEAVRDSLLAVAGKLDLQMGGPSFQDFVIEKPQHSPHYQYHLHDPNDPKSHRRSIYRFIVRSKQQPFLSALDCADPSLAVEKRNQTQTPQQALALLNNDLAVVMAKHFAERIQTPNTTLRQQLASAIPLALGRDASQAELDLLGQYAEKHGLANACRVIVNLNEFLFID